METIRLQRDEWNVDFEKPLGRPGGFGQVFLGTSGEGRQVAIKRLHISDEEGGHRELEMADFLVGQVLEHVVPVLDCGVDANDGGYYIVMAQAEMSLRDHMVGRSGPVEEDEAWAIIREIATGLAEVGQVVHRDLKPENVLLHDGVWKLADFGIAKFVGETSPRTLKDCMSAPYAAPEQWRFERSTVATDVYAIGVIAFELLAGERPFRGPSREDFRHQHLNEAPHLAVGSARTQQLVSMCLRKAPQARPSLARLQQQVETARGAPGASSRIAIVAAEIARAQSAEEARRSEAAERNAERAALARDALERLEVVINGLFDAIEGHASTAVRKPRRIDLGRGWIEYKVAFPTVDEGAFSESGWDVVCGAWLTVRQPQEGGYAGRESNLWFTNLGRGEEYGWYEVGYWSLGGGIDAVYPIAVKGKDSLRSADVAASAIMGRLSSTPRRPVQIEWNGEASFHRRWMEWLADAAQGSLRLPSGFPEEW